MTTGLTRQGLRRHPWAFTGPFITQFLAATLISGALGFDASLHAARLDPAEQAALTASGISDAALVFVVISAYLTVIIVGVAMASSIGRQARDIALLRAIGARPGQVRRAIAAQAAVVAVPATLLGVAAGEPAGRAWLGGLVAHGVVPAGVGFHASALALPVASAITVSTSLIGAMIAAIRPSRVKPAVALAEAGVPRGRVEAAVRTAVGLAVVATGLVLSVRAATGDPRYAVGNSFVVLLVLSVGMGLLGPAVLRVTGRLVRLAGGTGAVVADSLTVRAQAFSGALVPLVLAVAFTLVQLLQHATSVHVHGKPDPVADVWVNFSGTAVYVTFAAVAAVNTLVTVLLARRRELAVVRLAGASRARTLAIVICEAVVVTGTGLTLAAGVAAATLLPILHASLGTWMPYLQPDPLAGIVLTAAAVVGLGTAVPAAAVLRRPAVESVALAP